MGYFKLENDNMDLNKQYLAEVRFWGRNQSMFQFIITFLGNKCDIKELFCHMGNRIPYLGTNHLAYGGRMLYHNLEVISSNMASVKLWLNTKMSEIDI